MIDPLIPGGVSVPLQAVIPPKLGSTLNIITCSVMASGNVDDANIPNSITENKIRTPVNIENHGLRIFAPRQR
jgi:hypothetical protein